MTIESDKPVERALGSITAQMIRASLSEIFSSDQIDLLLRIGKDALASTEGPIQSPTDCKELFKRYACTCIQQGLITNDVFQSFMADISDLNNLHDLLGGEKIHQLYPWLIPLTTAIDRG